MPNIAIIRFSAIGDVALWVPVVKRALLLNKNLHITFITKKQIAFLFQHTERLTTIDIDLQQDYKGIFGIFKLAKFINANHQFDMVIDGHDVIRSKILLRFLKTKQKFTFDKGRKEKKAVVAKNSKSKLPHTCIRYANVLHKAGLRMDDHLNFPAIQIGEADKLIAKNFVNTIGNKNIIGIAPFAKHEGKIYPLHKMQNVIAKLSMYQIILFGAGPSELATMNQWQQLFSNIIVVNNFSFAQQIALMQYCQKIICMDSANMHIAAMQGIPVISIWGATHPDLGFAPLLDNSHNIVQISTRVLPCRPCAVFGNKPCTLTAAPYACMRLITEAQIVNAIQKA
jgi:ADP-heptose:LPS heptosyltransferase